MGNIHSRIIWDPRKCGPGTHPTNFAEFFDLKKFPGRRALPNRADLVLEVALLADGACSNEIYPLDIDRALKALDRGRSGIASWFSTTTQGVSLVQTGELDCSFSFASRAKATNEPGGGRPLASSFEQNVFSCETFAVLKRAPNRQNAMKLIGYILRPEVQVEVGGGVRGPHSQMAARPGESQKSFYRFDLLGR
ncbi:extracellular solute-binding protein [Bradyrhizobium sp. CCBAU 21360]|uniref:extracellular solute-binding protein n=1 Tax=Bradyrhizobium sp. CCBAU 21360 TaxID=1325081 RepID=UPI0023061619|nr:extracellular solute-binding protein [Bradyrhizobium sp. CCBAU 21360]